MAGETNVDRNDYEITSNEADESDLILAVTRSASHYHVSFQESMIDIIRS